MSETLDRVHGSLTPASDNWVPFISLAGEVAGDVLWMRDTKIGDNLLQSGIWRLLPGQLPETVDRLFPGNETIHILEGEVTIRLESGETVHLKTGDSAYFDKGIVSTWTFKTPFRKVFHIS